MKLGIQGILLGLLQGLLLVACTPAGADSASGQPVFNAQEKEWIARHPVLRIGILSSVKPIEYIEAGKPRGLSVEHLKVIAEKTGIQFNYVPYSKLAAGREMLAKGDVDVLSANRFVGAPLREDGIEFTLPYHLSTGLIITETGSRILLNLAQLDGKSVAIARQTPYEARLRARLPNARFVVSESAQQMLSSVQQGSADVGIATETFVLPYLDREFKARLQISGVIPEISSQFDLGVRAGDSVARSVLDKTLASLTPEEVHDIHDRWLGMADFEMAFATLMSQHYAHELMLGALVLLLLLALMYQAHRQRQRAKRNESDKTLFLAMTNHEIRSPMNAMLAAVELLRLTPLGQEQQRFADLADRGGQTLLRLLDEVLVIAKLDAGQLKLARAPVDVEALVRGVADLHRLRAQEKNIALTVTTQDAPARLMLDEARMAQVLHNLISNAIKFTETGGVDVAVRVGASDAPTRKLLHVAVCDTGAGLSEEAQARLFQPYAQAAGTYNRSGGTGLGLFICRELATLMGGTIAMVSAQGQGTTVTLSLAAELAQALAVHAEERVPKRPAAVAVPLEARVAAARLNHGAPRVLVVEDTPANQEVLSAQLQSLGCEPVIAPDAAQALSLFAHDAFALVLMDVDLPDKDGYTLTTELREVETRQARSRSPIVAISASTGDAHVERCLATGMDDVLSKPIRLAKLQGVIERYCGVLPTMHQTIEAPDPQPVRVAVDKDIDELLQAIALRETAPALRAALRIHGAAATLGRDGIVDATARLEALLRTADWWQTDEHAELLAQVMRGWLASTANDTGDLPTRTPMIR
ncbi:transporter substrate-binding domain-containing protein [Variovorax sp. H27-G14]|uniref:ATP-binding protein n=1 Tax=Variovorax sp. H27-G14 TaxID=3111914 RepID=UPI0038FCC3F0